LFLFFNIIELFTLELETNVSDSTDV